MSGGGGTSVPADPGSFISPAHSDAVAAILAEHASFDPALAEIDHKLAVVESIRHRLCDQRAALIVARQRELAARTAGPAPGTAP